MTSRSAVDDVLLMNGVDHLEAKPFIGRTLAAVNAALEQSGTGERIVHRHADGVCGRTSRRRVDAVCRERAADGERGTPRRPRRRLAGRHALVAHVTLSKPNNAAQIALEHYAERIASFARIDGAIYPQDQPRLRLEAPHAEPSRTTLSAAARSTRYNRR